MKLAGLVIDHAPNLTDPVNIDRRHLSKGQRAIIAARAFSETENQTEIARSTGLSAGRIGQAAIVLKHAPELADALISGATSLDDAYAMTHTLTHKAQILALNGDVLKRRKPLQIQGFRVCAPDWIRTSDPHRVKVVR